MPTNPYDSQTVAGFNASPPADDGSQVPTNLVTWQFHVDKLGTPVLTLAQDMNSEVLSAFGELIMTTDPGEDNVLIAQRFFS